MSKKVQSTSALHQSSHFIDNITISESVGKGHPDKICDQISDSILDEVLKQDPNARVAVETMASNRLIIIGGEIKTKAYVDFVKVAWGILFSLGYTENDFTIISNVNSQSDDISQGVDKSSGDIGAGDQGIVFGFATNETTTYFPLSATLAHELVKLTEQKRVSGEIKHCKSDMKSQVTLEKNGDKYHIKQIIMSVQHDENYDQLQFHQDLIQKVMIPVAKRYGLNTDFDTKINMTGKFVIGGPIGDTGLTGRKIIVDSYGDRSKHGGGAYSGKDYTKVDRSGAYLARYIAKNLVAAGYGDEIEVKLSYHIGALEPVYIWVDGKNLQLEIPKIVEVIKKVFPLKVSAAIEHLNLKSPIYLQTASYGHYGRADLNLPWEKLDKVSELKALKDKE